MPTVPKERALWFFIVYVLQFLGTLGMVIYQEVVANVADTALETAIAVGKGQSPFVFIIVVTTVIIVEGSAMLYDLYKREVEERTKRRTRKETIEETMQLLEEWDELSPEEKSRQSIAEFFRTKLTESDEEN